MPPIRGMETPRIFTTTEALQFGWQQTRANLKTLLPIAVLAAFLALLQQALRGPPDGLRALVSLGIQLLQVGVTMLWIHAALRLHDGEKLQWPQVFDGINGYFTFLLTAVLFALIVAGGMILLIVPGVLWAIKYGFCTFVAVDQKCDPLSALRESGRITDGQKGGLLVFGLALLGLNILGAIALGIGLFFTIPTSYLAAAWVYRRLEAHAGSAAHFHDVPSPAH
jgi:Protein of unknown function (DUF975)